MKGKEGEPVWRIRGHARQAVGERVHIEGRRRDNIFWRHSPRRVKGGRRETIIKRNQKQWNNPYHSGLFCIFTDIFPAVGVEPKHIVPSFLFYALAQVTFESVRHLMLAREPGRTIPPGPSWEAVAAKSLLSMSSDRGRATSDMSLRRHVAIAVMDSVLPYLWPWSAQGGKGRLHELCAGAHRRRGYHARVLESRLIDEYWKIAENYGQTREVAADRGVVKYQYLHRLWTFSSSRLIFPVTL